MAKSIGSPSVDGIKINDLQVLRKKEKNPSERDSAGYMRRILYCCFVQLVFPYVIAVSAAMENVKFEMRHQIIINFYRNHEANGKQYTVAHFAKMNVPRPRRTVCNTIARYESGNTHKQRTGTGRPKTLTRMQERKDMKEMENRNGSSLRVTGDSFYLTYPSSNEFH